MALINNRLKQILISDFFIITAIYSIAHGLILFNNGVFWDGWSWFNQTPENLFDIIKQRDGLFLRYLMAFPLLSDYGVVVLRVITFLLFFTAALFLYNILTYIKEIDSFSRLVIVLIFAIFPINEARISISVGMYALCYALFYLGFWVLALYINTNKYYLRILSLLIFFFSFSTNSFLVFYLIPLSFIFYKEKESIILFPSLFIKVITKYTDYLLLPIIFIIINHVFFQPSGIYENIYSISFKEILLSPINAMGAFSTSFISSLNNSFDYFIYIFFFSLIVFTLLNNREIKNTNNSWIFIKVGIIAFFLAVFTHLSIGRGFDYGNEWASRDELLIPLGAAFILYYGLKLLVYKFEISHKVQKLLYSILITAFIITNITNYLEFQRDWFKQLSIIENIKSSEVIKNNMAFVFDDKTTDLNGIGRYYRFYEYTGLMKYTFGNEKRFGISIEEYEDTDDINNVHFKIVKHRIYNMYDFDFSKPKYKVIIEHGSYYPTLKGTLKTLIFKWINNNNYKKRIQNILLLKYDKLS